MSTINLKMLLVVAYILVFSSYLYANDVSFIESDYCDYWGDQPVEQTRDERKARRQERQAERQVKRKAKKQETEEFIEKKREAEIFNPAKNTSNIITNSSPKQINTDITNSTTNSNKSTISTINNKNSTLVSQPLKTVSNNSKQSDSTRNQEDSILGVLLNSKSFWIGIIILFISFSILASGYKKRCNHCNKWWAMRTIGKKLVNEKASWIRKELKDKNRKGEVIRTREEAVPATVYTYLIHRRCKHCGYEDDLTKEEKREN